MSKTKLYLYEENVWTEKSTRKIVEESNKKRVECHISSTFEGKDRKGVFFKSNSIASSALGKKDILEYSLDLLLRNETPAMGLSEILLANFYDRNLELFSSDSFIHSLAELALKTNYRPTTFEVYLGRILEDLAHVKYCQNVMGWLNIPDEILSEWKSIHKQKYEFFIQKIINWVQKQLKEHLEETKQRLTKYSGCVDGFHFSMKTWNAVVQFVHQLYSELLNHSLIFLPFPKITMYTQESLDLEWDLKKWGIKNLEIHLNYPKPPGQLELFSDIPLPKREGEIPRSKCFLELKAKEQVIISQLIPWIIEKI